MSASERLTELERTIPQYEHGYFLPARTEAVIAALPEIIAVVKAVEEFIDVKHTQHPAYPQLRRPLAALDAKLDGTDWSKEQVGQEGC